MMARRTGGTHKGVEEKRRSLPIYHHYTLSPGKTKSHHPEAKCNHCQKEFVCGSKQRLIRHLRKCSHISNPEQIIAETLNTLARNSATGQLNHSILEASNLLPSQFPHHMQQQHHHSNPHHQQQVGQHVPSTSSTITTANINNNSINNNNTNNVSNHNTSGSSSNDTALIACTSTSNGSQQSYSNQPPTALANSTPAKRPQKRGRKPANQSIASSSPSIHVTTGLDGKTHFTPASQMPPLDGSANVGTSLIAQVHNGRQVSYAYHQANISATSNQTGIVASGGLSANHHPTPLKLNSDPIDKAYLKLVLTRNLPLSLSDTKEFQLWIKSFANEYKPPSSINLIAQNLKQEAQVARQRVSNILVKAPKKTINLELHSWPEKSREHLWYAIVAIIDHKRFLVSTRDVNGQQQYSDNSTNNTNNHSPVIVGGVKLLSEFIDDCIRRVGSDRVNSLVFSDINEIQARRSLNATHPSIVTYSCWWHFTNLLCSDIFEHNESFKNVMRNSNSLINFVNSRPRLNQNLERFCPFVGMTGSFCPKKNERRWYSHLVCYLLEYIKNNNEAIVRALETYSITQSHLSSDNNNNSSSQGGDSSHVTQNTNSSTQEQQAITCQDDAQLIEFNSIVMSSDYWTNLNLVLVYLKPIQEIVALTSSTVSTHSNNSNSVNNNNNNNGTSLLEPQVQHVTPSISPVAANSLSLSDYMCWFLRYGKTLIESWRQSPDHHKYLLIGRYFDRFGCEISDFKLLFAAYLLNPKHRCAFVTPKAKNVAIEEILTVASEFMPEETDGHTIFDQWKLYLVREEPYDVVYEESRSTPLEWWLSLPCAESIRRVALRILRLRAFTSAKPDSLFNQLYYYEDETKSSLSNVTFDDLAVLRYFYDYEDKVGQPHPSMHNHHNSSNNTVASSLVSNGCFDRGHAGLVHSQFENESTKFLPTGCIEDVPETNGQINDSLSITERRQTFSDSTFSDVVVESYMNHHHNEMGLDDARANLSIEDLPGYELFSKYVDYNEAGVQIVEEPIGKKKRKWTAQEILSKCQSNP